MKILSMHNDRELLASRNRDLVLLRHSVRGVATPAEAAQAARTGSFDLVLLGGDFPVERKQQLADELVRLLRRTRVLIVDDRPGHPVPVSEVEDLLQGGMRRKAA